MTKLKAKRKAIKVSQFEVAKACGITQQSYSNYELALREPKQATLKKLAEFFNCTVDELI